MTRDEIMQNLKGIYVPVVTPFNRRGDLDEAGFKRNIRDFVKQGVGGLLVAGSTGEGPYLSNDEKLRLVDWARRLVRPPQVLLATTGLETTRETIQLSREAIARGADAILAVPPSYFKSRMDSPTLTAHFQTVADALKRPLLIYSIPQFTGVHIEPAAIARLSRHGNIAGLKESSGKLEFMQEILRVTNRAFHVMVGSALIMIEALEAGAAGAILGPANYATELCLEIDDYYHRGDVGAARQIQEQLKPLVLEVNIRCGIPGIKYATDLCGYKGGLPRPPLLPLRHGDQRKVVAALRKARIPFEQPGAA